MVRYLMSCLVFLALPTVAMGQSTGQGADVGKRVALVIGNGSYERPEDSLPNPPNDARAMAAKLGALGFEVIEALDRDYRGMRIALRDFDRALQGADAGLFFYAGHGMEYQGRNYLFPTDAVLESEGDVSIGLIDVGQILHVMETRVPTRLLFLDACRNNPLARRFRGALSSTRSTQVGTGLARIDAAVGTFIAYATAPGQLAEDGSGRNSPFSTAMLRHLDEPGLDVDQLMRRVRNSVLEATNERQIPWNSSSLRGSFVLNKQAPTGSAAAVTKPTESVNQPQTAIDDDREAWIFAQRLDTAAGYEAYSDAHCPGGRYCGFAQAAIASKAAGTGKTSVTTSGGNGQLSSETFGESGPEVAAVERKRVEIPTPSDQQTKLARTLAEGWGRRRYVLRNGLAKTDPCGRNKETSRLNAWRPTEAASSPIDIDPIEPTSASHTMISTSFDIVANLAVHVAENELYLVESKRHVGSARGFCRLGALSKGLFKSLVASSAHFAGQNPQTLSFGYDQVGLMEFASALVTLQTPDGQRMCLAFVGTKGSPNRVDGFYCRGAGQEVDASEVEAILSRIRIDGVIG